MTSLGTNDDWYCNRPDIFILYNPGPGCSEIIYSADVDSPAKMLLLLLKVGKNNLQDCFDMMWNRFATTNFMKSKFTFKDHSESMGGHWKLGMGLKYFDDVSGGGVAKINLKCQKTGMVIFTIMLLWYFLNGSQWPNDTWSSRWVCLWDKRYSHFYYNILVFSPSNLLGKP